MRKKNLVTVKGLVTEIVNIDKLPIIDKWNYADAASEITIGDLHADAIKLFYFLTRHGVLQGFSDENYSELVNIYKRSFEKTTKEDVKKYRELLAKAVVNNQAVVRLMGDDICDRGGNDLFILEIIKKLAEAKVNLSILFSNHSIEFILAYEKNKKYLSSRLEYELSNSLRNLQTLINNKIVSRGEIDEIIKSYYLPNFKPLDYTLNIDKSEITLYSHAPIGLHVIESLAKKYNIKYIDETAETLANTIDKINEIFAKFILNGELSTQCDSSILTGAYCGRLIDPKTHPLEFLMCNRDCRNIFRPEQHNNYKINFVHGHDSKVKSNLNVVNLDCDLGYTNKFVGLNSKPKYTLWHQHEYMMLYINEPKRLEIEKHIESYHNAVELALKKISYDELKKITKKCPELLDESLEGKGTLLHYAMEQSRTDIIQLVFEIKTNLNDCLRNKDLAAQYILNECMLGHTEVVKILIGRYPDLVKHEDFSAQTPLIWAASHGHTELVNYLIACGSDLDHTSHRESNSLTAGFTVLHWAVKGNHLETVKILLNAGASVNIVSATGLTPKQLASDTENEELTKLFEDVCRQNTTVNSGVQPMEAKGIVRHTFFNESVPYQVNRSLINSQTQNKITHSGSRIMQPKK